MAKPKIRSTRFVPAGTEVKPPTPLPPPDVWAPLKGVVPVALVDLEPGDCRWPVHGGFCGCPNNGTGPYCDTHKAVARTGAPAVKALQSA